MKERFHIHTMRTVKSPSDPSVTTYFIWVNMRDLPANIPTDVNPRKPNMKTMTAKKLLDAVSGTDPYFDIHNRGIVILAKSVRLDAANSMVDLDLDDDTSRYGILDGGHTYRAIMDRRDAIPSDIDKFVKLEVFVGEDLDVAALSDARNTSVQVSDIALFNLEDRFDFIKKAIADQPYGDNIAYKDNDSGKTTPVSQLLKLMYAFNIDRFKDALSVPTASYTGKAAVFKDYRKEWDDHHTEDGSNPSEDNIYLQLSRVLPTLVALYERIQEDMPNKFKDYKHEAGLQKGNFGNLRGVEKRNGRARTLFTQTAIDYDVSAGYIMPIFGAFRALLSKNKDGHGVEWTVDPLEMWDTVGIALVQNTFDTETNPNAAGKMKTLWQSNYRIVEGEKTKKLLERLNQLMKEQR